MNEIDQNEPKWTKSTQVNQNEPNRPKQTEDDQMIASLLYIYIPKSQGNTPLMNILP